MSHRQFSFSLCVCVWRVGVLVTRSFKMPCSLALNPRIALTLSIFALANFSISGCVSKTLDLPCAPNCELYISGLIHNIRTVFHIRYYLCCRVVETAKEYVTNAIVNTVDHLGSVAYKVTNFLDEKVDEFSGTELQFSCMEQVLLEFSCHVLRPIISN